MRPARLSATLALAGALALRAAVMPAHAQAPAAPAQPVAPETVVATVNGSEITFGEIDAMAQTLPEQYRKAPPAVLLPLLVDQAIDRKAMAAMARKQALDKEPAVARELELGQEQVLANALIRQLVAPDITEAALRARYDRDIAGKPGEEEVHARHILVASESDAIKIIAELKKGADFATVAKARSTDPGAAQGGDLGFFKKGDMLPEFAEAAFAMKPGQISDKPVKTQYGWHVIKVEERRAAPPPSFEQSHDELRQAAIRDAIDRIVKQARADVTIVRQIPEPPASPPVSPTDTATPLPPAKKP